jgi:hypothetical protein
MIMTFSSRHAYRAPARCDENVMIIADGRRDPVA